MRTVCVLLSVLSLSGPECAVFIGNTVVLSPLVYSLSFRNSDFMQVSGDFKTFSIGCVCNLANPIFGVCNSRATAVPPLCL